LQLLETMLMADDALVDPSAPHLTRPENTNVAVVEFAASQAAVLERDGHVKLTILRHGKMNSRAVFR